MTGMKVTRRNAVTIGSSLAAAALLSPAAPASAADAPVWSGEYWAQKGDVKLYMYRKRLGAPKKGEAPKPVLFLVHGSSYAARTSYDLSLPGKGEYSLMNVFARLGYDVWTMDHEGYGRSSRTSGNSDVASGAADLLAAVQVLQKETGRSRYFFMGESSGALRLALFAQNNPQYAERLVLSALTYTGKGSPTLAKRGTQLDFYRAHPRRPLGLEQIRTVLAMDKAEVFDPALAEAIIVSEKPFGGDAPNGTYIDMTANLPVNDPSKLTMPILIAHGQYDGIATLPDLEDFYNKLPSGDKQFAVISFAAHDLVLGLNRAQFWHTMQAFLSMPPGVTG